MSKLSPQVIEQAAAYRRYVTRASAITPGFSSGESVAGSLEVGVAYEPGQLVRGAIAYAAVVALQDPTFVNGVKSFGRDPVQRQQVVRNLLHNPAYVASLPGSASAAGLVVEALGADGQRLYDSGKAVKQAAYDVQKQSWSKEPVSAPTARLAQAKAISSTAMTGETDEAARLHRATAGPGTLMVAGAAIPPPHTTTVTRGLAIAALAVLDEAGDEERATIQGLMSEPNIGSCLNVSKLNLYQCLAVSRPHYEDVFCLGQHAMMDTGRCVIRAAGKAEPYEARFIPDASSVARKMKPARPAPKKKTARS